MFSAVSAVFEGGGDGRGFCGFFFWPYNANPAM
jgi:hypothetical protein